MTERTIDPRRWCRDCKRVFARVAGVEVFAGRTERNGLRRARCRVCLVLRKRARQKMLEQRAAAEPLKPGQRCTECEGLGHRRPLSGCPRCGLAYVPEAKVEPALRKFDWAV